MRKSVNTKLQKSRKTADASVKQEFSETIKNTLARYKSTRYTAGLVKKLTEELQKTLVDFYCNNPSNEKRISELHKKLAGKALFMDSPLGSSGYGVFFVSAVGSPVNRNDIVSISGLLYVSEDSKSLHPAYVKPMTLRFDLDKVYIRESELRVHAMTSKAGDGYVRYPFVTETFKRDALKNAKESLACLASHLEDF
jgi:hypothetical protein